VTSTIRTSPRLAAPEGAGSAPAVWAHAGYRHDNSVSAGSGARTRPSAVLTPQTSLSSARLPLVDRLGWCFPTSWAVTTPPGRAAVYLNVKRHARTPVKTAPAASWAGPTVCAVSRRKPPAPGTNPVLLAVWAAFGAPVFARFYGDADVGLVIILSALVAVLVATVGFYYWHERHVLAPRRKAWAKASIQRQLQGVPTLADKRIRKGHSRGQRAA
jgi:hypothetical protein